MKKKYILKDGLYAKVKRLDLTKWVVTKFYHYTSCARDFIAEYDPIWNGSAKDGTAWGDPYLKELYDHFQTCVDAYLNYPGSPEQDHHRDFQHRDRREALPHPV